jgi:hypothetical protein
VRRDLREKLVEAPGVTTELMEQLDRKFGLREKYNIRVGLWQFLIRERNAVEEDNFIAKLRALRKQQLREVKVLEKTVGGWEREHWENSAYLRLVELMYTRLMDEKSELPREELMALSKAMAEHRRVSVREPGKGDALTPALSQEERGRERAEEQEKSFEKLAETVREIYGTNWQATMGTKGQGDPGAAGTGSGTKGG